MPASGVAGTLDGLEAARFSPAGTGNEAFFGLGDWFTAGLDPTERLDLLNGRARIRQLPTDPQADDSIKVLVIDTAAGPDYGVVKWKYASAFGNNAPPACDWTVTAIAPNHVWTAVGPANPNCPDDAENVGIGNSAPFAKLDIIRSVNAVGATSTGVNVRMGTTSVNNIGGNSDAQSTATGLNLGWRGSARNGSRNWGLDGNAAVNSLDSTVLWVTPRGRGCARLRRWKFPDQSLTNKGGLGGRT